MSDEENWKSGGCLCGAVRYAIDRGSVQASPIATAAIANGPREARLPRFASCRMQVFDLRQGRPRAIRSGARAVRVCLVISVVNAVPSYTAKSASCPV